MKHPKSMTAIEISAPGNADVLTSTCRPLPQPTAHEVLIKVAAAGINRPDIMQRRGLYPAPAGASDIPGLEVSGTIVDTGCAITRFKEGDRVCALVTGGGYAEYCTAASELCLPIPDNLNVIQAAALPETFFTVWSNLFDRARLLPDETVLIHGGSSGIGTTAIQLAKVLSNATVLVTVGSEHKRQFCKMLGADFAINYKTEDFVNEVKRITNQQGVDVILDIIGGDYFPRNLSCMAEESRLIQIAIQHGPKSEINLLPIMLKRLTITGSTLRARSLAFKAMIAKELLAKVWPLLSDNQIKPVIDSYFPLQKAAKAHKRMESSQHIGKIILTTAS